MGGRHDFECYIVEAGRCCWGLGLQFGATCVILIDSEPRLIQRSLLISSSAVSSGGGVGVPSSTVPFRVFTKHCWKLAGLPGHWWSPGPRWQKKSPPLFPGTLLAAMWVMAPLPLRSEACLDHGGHALSQTICVHYLVLCRELPQTQRLDTTIDVFHTVSVGQECGPWSWMVLPGRELWLGRSHCVGRARFLHSPWGWQAGAGC